MNSYLAVDIGASSGRHVAAFMRDGRMELEEVYRFSNGARMKDGHLCWDMDALVNHVVAGMRAAKEKGFVPTAMGIDTWAVDFVLLDGEDRPVGDLIAYRDGRTQGMDSELERTLPFDRHYGITGIARQPFNTVYQMMAALREHPEYRDTVRDFLMVPEYLNFKLTGKKMHEWTNASTTALCDARTRDWSEAVIGAAGLPAHWFERRVCQPGAMVGRLLPEVQAAAGFDTDLVLTATHDTGSAYLAVPDAEAAFLSSGTWSLLGAELRGACTTAESRRAGFTNEGGYAGTTRYLKNIMGLWMLQCIRRELKDAYSFAEMAEMAANSGYNAYIDAADNRFLAPESMLKEVEAALCEQGAPGPAGIADVLRAVHLGLAACYRDTIEEMSRLTGRRFTSVSIVGGGSQNRTLNRLTAQLTGLPVYAGPTEGTAIGNLVVQMLAKGEFASLREARRAIKESFRIEEVIQ